MERSGDEEWPPREYSPNTREIIQILLQSPTSSEQGLLENMQPADEQQFEDPNGFLHNWINKCGMQPLTRQHLGQPDTSTSIDQGCEQNFNRSVIQTTEGKLPLTQQQLGTTRKKRQRSTADSQSPGICETIAGDKVARKRQNDKRYRDRIKQQKQQMKSDLEELGAEHGQLKHEYQEMKSKVEKLEAENGRLKNKLERITNKYKKLERITNKYKKLKRKNTETVQGRYGYSSVGLGSNIFRFTQGFGDRQPGNLHLTGIHRAFIPNQNTLRESMCQTKDQRKYDDIDPLEWPSNFVDHSLPEGSLTINNKDDSSHYKFQIYSPMSVLESSSDSLEDETEAKSPLRSP
ncbi:hypothetical protein SLEP1_g40674 [Rubroshorea leprosula]|uniref:BZIP domain-containing protein n=1 Tax=Rubroshorea leprosula TaxID=152421 RepID=A0AAV5L4R5_9ROSI|nr:hypothetical protein SLEP1_g40674 [Rubroshorea leprosula]